MTAMFAELLPQHIVRYLGKTVISTVGLSEAGGGPGLGCASQKGRIESVLGCVLPERWP
jgi:hypothetical protein